MSVLAGRWSRLLGLIGLCGLTTAHGQSNWPAFDEIHRVDVIVFEHCSPSAQSQVQTRAQTGLTRFDQARRLAFSLNAHARAAKAAPRPVSEWLDWLVDRALIQAASPLVGPPPRLDVPEPVIQYPLLWAQPIQLPTTLRQAVERLTRAPTHRVVSAHSWHQPLGGNHDAQAVRIGPLQVPDGAQPPWPVPNNTAMQTLIDGQLRLSQGQFLRAEVELVKHTPRRRASGPLRLSWLHPVGYSVENIDARQVIETEQWVYFDHPTLGVLLKVSPMVVDP
mgnify:CR=1 FL=1